MKRIAAALLVWALFAPSREVVAESVLTVACEKTIAVPAPNATSAYSVNPSIAEAGEIDGVVQVRGVGAGTTTVVVVTRDGSTSYTVTVTAPQLSEALGVGPSGAGEDRIAESGTYEGSYSSGAGQVSNTFDFRQQQGTTMRRATLVAATYVTPSGGGHGTGIPFISYEIKKPGHDVVLLDQEVSTSPLTSQNALVRGVHVQSGPWIVHAGASSIASFGSYFIPTNPQWFAGVTRDIRLSRTSDVAANVYDIINSAGVSSATPGGVIGSLLYTYHPQPHFIVQGEVGLSRGIGLAANAAYDDSKQHFDATFLDKPANFATLATDAQQGVFAGFNYTRAFNDAFNISASAQQSNYNIPAFRANTLIANTNANYRFGKDWSASAGTLYSSFNSISPTAFNSRTLAIPLSIDYASRHISAGISYQPTTNFSGSTTAGYGANLGFNYGAFQVGGFYNHNVDIPTVASIFSEVPGLQAALEAAGITITDPSQLAALLNNASLLASLGFSGLQLNVAPARNDIGFNANWSPAARGQQLAFSFLNSNAQLTDGSFGFRLATLTYTRKLSNANEAAASVSMLRSTSTTLGVAGSPSTSSTSAQTTYGMSFRHRFGSVPGFLFPTRRGAIAGYVFRDDDSSGQYAKSDPGLAGIEVTLDGEHTTRTDASGHYSFAGVPYGSHQVAAKIEGRAPFYFTTDSPATAQIGSTVNFGVNYVQGKIFGYLTNDAGQGIAGVAVQVQGTNKSATTESDGRFVFEGVAPGHYMVTASPESFPTGYDLSTFSPVPISVNANAPWPVNLSARALRSISGTVSVFDPDRHAVVPARFMEVSIQQLGISGKTDENGVYVLRNLPAGNYTVQVDGGTSSERHAVTLPADPTVMTGVNFRVTVAQVNQRLREHQREERLRRRR